MRVPLSWLREYVDLPDDPQSIADRLAMLGFPVEEIARRPEITGVVVGRILSVEKHPNADLLQVCKVDTGGPQPLTIATAAKNVAPGQTIPVATIGAKLPHLTIEPRKMRGVMSEGMMVSADELALPAEWFEDGIMQLDDGTPLGADVVERFGLRDAVLEVEITSNRVDAMSMIGIARELAASFGVPLRAPSSKNPGTLADPNPPRVSIESDGCRRFIAQRFDGVRVGPAPAWMRLRLALAGQRPINNLVDVSNYVMFETGQPLHFYDAARVADNHFVVRDARPGEKLRTLDDVERTLDANMLVIADDREALGLAGVMGGLSSEVRPETQAILMEAATFAGVRVRRMSMALGLRSEASSRHEKSLPLVLAETGAARAAQLLASMGARAFVPVLAGESVTEAPPIELTAFDVYRLLGLELEAERIARHLELLGCTVTIADDVLQVRPPLWRSDLTIAADLVEEVARIEGYDEIPAIEPSVPSHAISSAEYRLEDNLASALAALGYHEIASYALQGTTVLNAVERSGAGQCHVPVAIRNPLTEEQRVLRWSLAPGMYEYLARIDAPFRAFELGHVFSMDEGAVGESSALIFGFAAEPLDEPAWRDSHFLRLKADCEALFRAISGVTLEFARDERPGLHPGKTAVGFWRGREAAALGKIDPRAAKAFGLRLPVYACNIYLDNVPEFERPLYRPPSRYPSTYRDLAVVVELDVTAERVANVVREALGELCTRVNVFDEYRGPQAGEGRKSLAVRATLQHYDRTITDEEADEAMARAVQALHDVLGGTIRR